MYTKIKKLKLSIGDVQSLYLHVFINVDSCFEEGQKEKLQKKFEKYLEKYDPRCYKDNEIKPICDFSNSEIKDFNDLSQKPRGHFGTEIKHKLRGHLGNEF